MGINVLGPLILDGQDGLGLRDRVVLETLVVRSGQVVDKEVLADALWGEAPPVTWPKVVHGCIGRLRKLLGAAAIETTPYGYRLITHDDELDARRFERLLGRARENLGDLDPDRASYVLDEALSLWRGRAFPDLDEWEPGRVEAERLDGLRMEAQELRVEAEIAAGRSRASLEAARTLVKEAPVRERRWALFARALYQAGRQTESLEVLNRARRMLRDELGLDPGPELTALEESILRQDPELASAEPVVASLVCPYRGLLSYEAEDAESFFGRDADVAACLKRLRDSGVLAVVGPSGTGKSSVVRAGVVASLEREGVKVLVTTPGARPLDSLAPLPVRGPLPVLVVDQAEEAATLCFNAEERSAYFDKLAAYGAPLVLALRADRLGDLSTYPAFARLVERGFYLLAGMHEEDLRAVIEGPARHAGLRLEPGLVDLLVREVEGEPAALPMLSHVLRQTWERREGPTLTVEGYRATGGIRDAVSQSAEGVYDKLDDRQRAQIRALFLRLVMPSDEGQPVRARVARTKLALDASHERLIESLVDARLLSSDEGDVQIAHEALAREWPRLRDWLDEDVEGQRIFRHLASTAEAWGAMDRPDSELYRGVRLVGAADWADRNQAELTDTERAFLEASSSAAERELRAQARSNRRLRLSLVSTAALLVVALVAGFLARQAADESAESARVADSRRLASQALLAQAPDLAVLLAVESVNRDDSPETRAALYTVLGKTSQLRDIARGGSAGFNAVAVSPDGSRVVTGGSREGIEAHNAVTLEEVASTEEPPAGEVAFSPDGRLLAYTLDSSAMSEPDPHPVRLVSASSLEPTLELGGTPERSFVERGLAFSADGTRLAASLTGWDGGNAEAAQVWDLDRPGRPVATIPYDGVRVSLALSPAGDIVYLRTRGPDVIRSYDVRTGRLKARLGVNTLSERVPPLVISPDGSLLATSHADGVAVIDASSMSLRFVLPGLADGVSSLAFSPDGTMLASGFTSGTTIVWRVDTRTPLRTFRGHTQPVESLAFSPDGDSLYTVGTDSQLLTWVVTGAPTFPPSRAYPENPVNGSYAEWSPDGRTIAHLSYGDTSEQAAGENGWPLRFRDVASGRLTEARLMDRNFPSVSETIWTPDSREYVASGGARPTDPEESLHMFQTWNPISGERTFSDPNAGMDIIRYTSDARQMVTYSAAERTVTLRDRETRAPLGDPIAVGEWIYDGATLSPDGRTFYLPVLPDESDPEGQLGYVDVVDLDKGEVVAHKGWDTLSPGIEFSPDGKRVVLHDWDGNWAIMGAEDLLADDPKWIVPPRRFNGPNEFHGVSWGGDGSQVITVGPGSVDLWDAATLTHVGTLSVGAADQTPDVWVAPQESTLMIVHPSGTVATWDTRPQHLLDVACETAGRNLTKAEWADLVGDRRYRETCP